MVRQITRQEFTAAIERAIAASSDLGPRYRELLREVARIDRLVGVGSWSRGCPLMLARRRATRDERCKFRAGVEVAVAAESEFAAAFDAQFVGVKYLQVV